MRIPSYRKHSSGQARVTINGKDHLLGPYGSPASKEAYGRLIAEFAASGKCSTFGKVPDSRTMAEVLLAFLRHAKVYYPDSGEYYQYKLATKPIAALYSSLKASDFGPPEFKAVRAFWLETPAPKVRKDKSVRIIPGRSRQYINKQMKRTLLIVKWAVASGMMPADNYTAIKCVDSLKCGRCDAKESTPVTCVEQSRVDATLPHLTAVLSDMVKFQQLVGCRPGELVVIKPSMVDRSSDVWAIELAKHKTAYRGKKRTIYVGPQAQAVLAPYLLRDSKAFCFSPIESEKQRRAAVHLARKTPLSCGNRPGSNVARKPRKEPGDHYTTGTYARAIRYACQRSKINPWSPNQLRHNAATAIRREFGIEAASVILGHSGLEVTQIYAEQDKQRAIEVTRKIG